MPNKPTNDKETMIDINEENPLKHLDTTSGQGTYTPCITAPLYAMVNPINPTTLLDARAAIERCIRKQ